MKNSKIGLWPADWGNNNSEMNSSGLKPHARAHLANRAFPEGFGM